MSPISKDCAKAATYEMTPKPLWRDLGWLDSTDSPAISACVILHRPSGRVIAAGESWTSTLELLEGVIQRGELENEVAAAQHCVEQASDRDLSWESWLL